MRALDLTFTARVQETTLALAAIVLLPLLSLRDAAVPCCFAVGVGAAILFWKAATVVCTQLGTTKPGWRVGARLAAVYLGKYVVVAAALWLLVRSSWLRPVAFTAGFVLPTIVVFLKAVALVGLPESVDEAPYYSRFRKVGRLG